MPDPTYESVYPDFLRAGLTKLQRQGARNGDFLGLFSALEQFRRDITERRDVKSILKVAEMYVLGLGLFDTIGFFLIRPEDFDFELTHCAPAEELARLDGIVRQEMKAGRFAWALRQSAPAFFTSPGHPAPIRGVFHTLGVARQRLGMFCGLLRQERVPSQEITFSLLSILLGACSDALAGVRATDDLRHQILATNDSLQQALRENQILARIPAESPNPVLRLSQNGRVLYSNEAGDQILRSLGWQVGDLISGEWLGLVTAAFGKGARHEFEAAFGQQVFTFLIVPVPEAGYANFYGTEITARKRAETERENLIAELQDALVKVKTLSGLVPICAWCKKIRDDRGFWSEVEVYVQKHSQATFSHGVCPHCREKWLAAGARTSPPAE